MPKRHNPGGCYCCGPPLITCAPCSGLLGVDLDVAYVYQTRDQTASGASPQPFTEISLVLKWRSGPYAYPSGLANFPDPSAISYKEHDDTLGVGHWMTDPFEVDQQYISNADSSSPSLYWHRIALYCGGAKLNLVEEEYPDEAAATARDMSGNPIRTSSAPLGTTVGLVQEWQGDSTWLGNVACSPFSAHFTRDTPIFPNRLHWTATY